MDILSSADVGPLLLAGLSLASFVTAFIGVFTGAAGGVILLAIMAMVMPPTAVIPVHTIVMLGTGMPTLEPILDRPEVGGAPVMSCNLCLAWRSVEALDGQTPGRASLEPWLQGEGWVAQLNERQ